MLMRPLMILLAEASLAVLYCFASSQLGIANIATCVQLHTQVALDLCQFPRIHLLEAYVQHSLDEGSVCQFLRLYCGYFQVDGESVAAQYTVELRPGEGVPGASPVLALGRLDAAHLADHPAAEAALSEALVDGSELGPLLILERLEVSASLTHHCCSQMPLTCQS